MSSITKYQNLQTLSTEDIDIEVHRNFIREKRKIENNSVSIDHNHIGINLNIPSPEEDQNSPERKSKAEILELPGHGGPNL